MTVLFTPARWANGILAIFFLLGLGFGSWLSRLPAVRDHLDASTLEMSAFGLVLAVGSLLGLAFSGRTVTLLGARRTLEVGVVGQALAMPPAALLFWDGHTLFALACLAFYGFCFGTCDVAMNVSGAGAERALGTPRMPLLHAGYSLGSVSAMGIGALTEVARVPVPIHLTATFAVIAVGVLLALRVVPRDERQGEQQQDGVHSAGSTTHLSEHTAPLTATPRPRSSRYNPWRDPRILAVGVITMSMGLAEGAASDWLPLALTDERDFQNEAAALTLGIFFVSMTLTRITGSWLLTRFGRVRTLRGGTLLVVAGLLLTILVPLPWAGVLGAVLWGTGCALGFPIGISAAADDPATAVRGVAAVSAIAYASYLLGPMTIGVLGEHFGLLQAFWPLVGFAAIVFMLADATREPRSLSTQ